MSGKQVADRECVTGVYLLWFGFFFPLAAMECRDKAAVPPRKLVQGKAAEGASVTL